MHMDMPFIVFKIHVNSIFNKCLLYIVKVHVCFKKCVNDIFSVSLTRICFLL